jgi:putative ABC transport system permease protein
LTAHLNARGCYVVADHVKEQTLNLIQDLKYTFRLFRRAPKTYALIILALALGIGANAAVFSVISAVLLRPLPYLKPDKLVSLSEHIPEVGEVVLGPDYLAWQDHNKVLQDVAAIDFDCKAVLMGTIDPSRVTCARVSSSFFAVLGIQPSSGRSFSNSEDQTGGPDVAVLSHALWQKQFGGDAGIVGRNMTLDNKSYAIVGIMPQKFRFGDDVDLWLPLKLNRAEQGRRDRIQLLSGIGRLAPGVSLQRAEFEIDQITQQGARANPALYPHGVRATVIPLQERFVVNYRKVILLLLAAVLFLHLIACTNIVNLQLARSLERRSEVAMRLAIGASKHHLLRMLFIEGTVLAAIGAAIGMVLAFISVGAVVALSPLHASGATFGIDARTLAFTLLIGVTTAVVIGVIPAITVRSTHLADLLRSANQGVVSSFTHRHLRNSLLVAEVTLTMVLVIGAGATVRGMLKLQAVDLGFDINNLLTASFGLDRNHFAANSQRIAFIYEVLNKTSALPGVSQAAAYQPSAMGPVTVEGRGVENPDNIPKVLYVSATENFFPTMKVPLKSGRMFLPTDTEGSTPVAVISDSLAVRLFNGTDPIGKRIKFGPPSSPFPWLTIVGVVGTVRKSPLQTEPEMTLYSSYLQNPTSAVTIVVRTVPPARSLAQALQSQIRSLNKDQVFDRVNTWEERIAGIVAPLRFNMVLLVVFAGLAMCHSAIGVYGLVTRSVAERSNELALRLAFGASRGQVVHMIFNQYLTLTGFGSFLGILGAYILSRILSGQFNVISGVGVSTYFTVTLFVIVIAICASYLGTRAVTTVEPMAVLRAE